MRAPARPTTIDLAGEVAELSKAAVLKTVRHLYHWPLTYVSCAHNAHTLIEHPSHRGAISLPAYAAKHALPVADLWLTSHGLFRLIHSSPLYSSAAKAAQASRRPVSGPMR